jgi:phospholipid/cholesterol/gamma-HCH transport system ATP-binding protein
MEGEKVLDNVNLFITPETTTVIFGLSGSGKSTLLKSLAGLIRIDDGEVLFNSINIGKMNEKAFFEMQAQSGFVFQDAALWANRTIYENLAIPLRILNPLMDVKEIDKRVKAAVDIFNFRDDLQVRPAAVSAGEKKILSFLRALMTDPDILFLDEPTTSIDKKNISRINSIIKELKKKKKTIITVTHDLPLARSIADNIILIDNGSIVKTGTFIEILDSDEADVLRIIEEMKGQV